MNTRSPLLQTGQRLFRDRFTLERPLGRGANGVVWLARDNTLHTQRALKCIPVDQEHRLQLDLLRVEAGRSQQLTHANIVRVFDYFEDADLAALSMEFIDGFTLRQALNAFHRDDGPAFFEHKHIHHWVVQWLEALHYAHAQGIVHCDLKPANLMVSSGTDQLKVTDFGIAQSLTDHHRLSGASGTLAYMSPQRLQGAVPTVLDDIYAIGATLHELLTGQTPVAVHGIPPTIDESRLDRGIERSLPVPAPWVAGIEACLEKDPANRPQSIEDVAAALDLEEATLPVYRAKPSPSRIVHQLETGDEEVDDNDRTILIEVVAEPLPSTTTPQPGRRFFSFAVAALI
ncbi:MAG: serine/threonine-protein kinase, partial [Verrucomicrobiota bacterium]